MGNWTIAKELEISIYVQSTKKKTTPKQIIYT